MVILVTGSSGFLGRHTVPILKNKYGEKNIVGVNSTNYDLLQISEVERMFRDVSPDILIHFAAYSGGIGVNKLRPADFYYINTILTANVFQTAAKFKIKKLIYPMGGCSYPALSTSPINEDDMWSGYPQNESAGYSMAKKMGIVAATAYKEQYKLNSTILVPGNMYGEFDNFRVDESHVIPAMIRRFFEAKLNNTLEVTMWGTGAPERDFVYAGDVAKTIPFFIDHYNNIGPVNISSGKSTSIRTLAKLIADNIGYQGEMKWDSSKPDGQKIKIFDVKKLNSLGISCPTNLDYGLIKTIDWFINNFQESTDGLRK